MTGLDTTVLVELADVDHAWHAATAERVQLEANSGRHLLVAPQVMAEFLHVVTDARRFQKPLTIPRALDWLDEFAGNAAVRLLMPTDESVRLAGRWMRQFDLGRKRILDTQLAASLHCAGATRLLTSNPDDFRIFGVFELVSP